MVRMTPYLGTKFDNGNPDGPPTNWVGVRAKFPVFICPETRLLPGTLYYSGNYGMNVEFTCGRNDLAGAQKDSAWAARRTLYTIKSDPSLIVLTNDNHYVTEVNGWQDITANLTYAYPRVHFQKKINIQFVDGHVALIGRGDRGDLTVKDAVGTGW
jgi:prepilin-type processing-associated H-X9-DG protein